MLYGRDARRRLRGRKVFRLFDFFSLFELVDHFRGHIATQHHVLNVGSVRVGILCRLGKVQRGDQAVRVNRIGEGLEQIERTEPALQKLQSLAIG